MTELCVATMTVRNTVDWWRQRRGLLVRQWADLAPDVIGVQELRVFPNQSRWIGAAVERRSSGGLRYERYRRAKTGRLRWWEGIGVMSRLPVMATASISLETQYRVAQRVTVRLPGGGVLDFYNTHLGRTEEIRTAQAQRILDWMATRPPVPVVLTGDLNARPGSPTIELLSRSMRSAYAAVHGQEPPRTVPTPLRRGSTGEGSVLDYIFVNDLIEVRQAGVAFDEIDTSDPRLAASDHYGLAATIAVSESYSPASPNPRPR